MLSDPTGLGPAVKAPYLSWADLVSVEPELAELEREARNLRHSWPTYESLKRRLKALVGWDARRPELQSAEAWEVAIQRIAAALESPPGGPRRKRHRARGTIKRRREDRGLNLNQAKFSG